MNNMQKPLTAYLERIEKLREEKKEIADTEKDVFTEAQSAGFDKTMMREMLKLRAMDKEARRAKEELRDTYINALDLV